ncbi:MAG: aminopeptidase, partial [Chloroflexia bacterium]|nr:aminopeptidase [Chloroflexia bacterium]
MQDPRIAKLAQLLVQHSMRVAPDEKVLIESFDIPTEMTVALIRAVAEAGG